MIIGNISTILSYLGFFTVSLLPSTHADYIFESAQDNYINTDRVQSPGKRSCRSPIPTIEEGLESDQVVKKWKKKGGMKKFSIIQVPTHYHVIKDGSKGNTQTEVNDSITVLNNAYAPYFSFNLVDTTYTVNSSWFNTENKETQMKTALRAGGCDALNIYATSGYGALGFAYFPTSCGSSSNPWVNDGVVIDYSTVPGGSRQDFNEGDTLTHEVGHWLGLYHTFDGGCSGQGDYVDDTPAHTVNYQCQNTNTCNSSGQDPIQNFMNYTPDSCMDEFTRDQYDRMVAQWDAYRKPAFTGNPTKSPVKQPTSTASPTKSPVKQPTTTTSSPTNSPVKQPTSASNPTSSPVKQPTSTSCFSVEGKKACRRDNCFWDKTLKSCFDSKPSCAAYVTRRLCYRTKCWWENKMCVSDKPCKYFFNRRACKKANCDWNNRKFACKPQN